jgi:hypothetical protein
MAGEWLPMRMDLTDDPAVISMAAALNMDEFAVVGRLHRLWGWANRHLSSGNAPSVTEQWIDRFVSAPGFAAAMLAACPKGPEERRSGTWATVRYARKTGKPVVIFWPDGTVTEEK